MYKDHQIDGTGGHGIDAITAAPMRSCRASIAGLLRGPKREWPQKTVIKQRSARARGLRTLQHQTLPAATRYAIDTEVWFRGLMTAGGSTREQRWATKDQVHDEALANFLKHHARVPFDAYPMSASAQEDLTFWLDSKLMARARRMAVRDGVKVRAPDRCGLACYVKQHIPSNY